jgi:hypothetical protein
MWLDFLDFDFGPIVQFLFFTFKSENFQIFEKKIQKLSKMWKWGKDSQETLLTRGWVMFKKKNVKKV